MRVPFENKEYAFGVHRSPVGDIHTLKDTCLMVEKLGYDLITIWEHFINPYGVPALDCWSVLSVLADVTNEIQLGPLVSCVNFRHPTVLAKMATTVDIISNGRLVMGLGAGWLQEEFEEFFGRFPPIKERLDGLEDAARITKGMFENERTSYEGLVYSAHNTLNVPGPVRGTIPIIIGGVGERRTLKIAAKYADIIHIAVPSYPPLLEHKVQVIKKHCENVGRDFDEIILGTFLFPILEEYEESMEQLTKVFRATPLSESEALKTINMTLGSENIIQTIRLCHDLGIKLFTIWSGFNPKLLEMFKNEVIYRL